MKRALVTGGAGFIGSHLAEALLERGFGVHVLDDLSTGSEENLRQLSSHSDFCFTRGSVLERSLVEEAVAGCDLVVHLAAAVGVERIIGDAVATIETNVRGTQHLLQAAASRGTRTLIASSSEVYGKNEAVPFAEDGDRVLGPTTCLRWSYAVSKTIGEHLALAYHRQAGLPVTIVRPFNTIGPRQTGRYGMVVPRFVKQAREGDPLTVYGDGRQRRSFCDVGDVVRAVILLAEHPGAEGGVFNIGSPDELEIVELARKVLRLATGDREVDDRIRFVPYEQAYAPGFEDMRRRRPDVERIRELTGWQPVIQLEETLSRLLGGDG
jgi:UDP-glucose 4-epimerase